MALRLLGAKLPKYMDGHNLAALPMDTWENVFLNINTLSERTCHIFAFDDADEILTDSVFSAAFQKYFETQKRRAILIIFVTRAEKLFEFPPDYNDWTYDEIPIDVPYFSIADHCKCFPNKKGDDLLALYAITRGIPALVDLIDENLSTEDNLRKLLSPDSQYTHSFAQKHGVPSAMVILYKVKIKLPVLANLIIGLFGQFKFGNKTPILLTIGSTKCFIQCIHYSISIQIIICDGSVT